MNKAIIILANLLFAFGNIIYGQGTGISYYGGNREFSAEIDGRDTVSVTVIYDNYIHAEGMKEDWGYSCYIDGLDKTILFDTGTRPDIFSHNFKLAGLDADAIDEVFISHEHGDHTGGLPAILDMTTDLVVVVPETFNDSFFRSLAEAGVEAAKIREPVEICENLYTTGIMGASIPEQALVINTGKGLVVMTGCSHPGITDMLKSIKETFGRDIYMVFGGFHLMNYSEKGIDTIIKEMQELGVTKCGATHCTGEMQIEMFRQAFGDNFVEMGAGNRITFF